jgi:predicted anti-sigma-YlaC factor YlaD
MKGMLNSEKVDCQKVSASLIPYLDGRATVNEQTLVESHVAVCAACRTRLQEFSRLFGVLDELPPMQPSPSFDARVRQRISDEPRSSWFGWLLPAPRLAFSLAVLLGLFTWMGKFQATPVDNTATTATTQSEQDFRAIRDLGVLENYDVLQGFDALSELPVPPPKPATEDQDNGDGGGQL